MSRIGKQPIELPSGVEVTLDGNTAKVKGPKGELTRTFHKLVVISREDNVVRVAPVSQERQARALFGLSRTLLNNMVEGVSKGFEKRLEIQGVGYRAQVQGNKLVLQLGYSNPVELDIPQGITVAVENNTKLTVSGYDKQAIGDFAAHIRSKRPPEPYKGKGVRYAGERIVRKAGKAGKKK